MVNNGYQTLFKIRRMFGIIVQMQYIKYTDMMESNRYFIKISVMVIVLFTTLCCKLSIAQNDSIKVKKMLQSFYYAYIDKCNYLNFGAMDSLRAVYCTDKCNKEYDNSFKDFDPFIDANMCDTAMIKTLKFWKDSINDNVYYTSNYYAKIISIIKLRVVMENGTYKIDHLFVNEYKHIKIDSNK
jgi:hypothetical protein